MRHSILSSTLCSKLCSFLYDVVIIHVVQYFMYIVNARFLLCYVVDIVAVLSVVITLCILVCTF
jgi:hypothetical protein